MSETTTSKRPKRGPTWDTHKKQQQFLAAFRSTCSIKAAAAACRIPTGAHWEWVRRNEAYRAAWEASKEEAIQQLEDEAVRRAHEGVKNVVLYQGRPVRLRKGKLLYQTEYSDSLLLALLKAMRPDKYRERTTTEVTGSIDIIDRLQAARKRLIAMQHVSPSGTAG